MKTSWNRASDARSPWQHVNSWHVAPIRRTFEEIKHPVCKPSQYGHDENQLAVCHWPVKRWVGGSSTALHTAAAELARVVQGQKWGMFHTPSLTVPSAPKSGNNMLKPWPCLLCVSNVRFHVSTQSWINLKLNSLLGENILICHAIHFCSP